eukprot:3632913-Amphidinium_carterae.2
MADQIACANSVTFTFLCHFGCVSHWDWGGETQTTEHLQETVLDQVRIGESRVQGEPVVTENHTH